MAFKKCSCCGIVKSPENFYEGRNVCKTCYKKQVTKQHYVREYGITEEDYNEKLKEQLNKCCICGIDQDDVPHKFHVDHCHSTGVVRGLLCPNCNIGLGHFRHNPKIMKTAQRYIELYGD